MQHDAVVSDPVFIAKEECFAANVPNDANKEGTSISLIQIHPGLCVISTEQLHKHTVMLKMKSTLVIVGSKQMIN